MNSHDSLVAKLEYLDDMYRLGQPVVTDDVYDAMVGVLRRDRPDHPFLTRLREEPVYGDSFQEVNHAYPMLSLDNIFGGYPEMLDWVTKPEFREINNGNQPRIVLEPKIDGMAIELHYVAGELKHAVTRGDGEKGFDIVRHFRHVITGAPVKLKDPLTVTIRGELYVPSTAVPAGYKTARNAVAGLCRKHHLTAEQTDCLRFICYGHAGEGSSESVLMTVRDQGVMTTLSCRVTMVGNESSALFPIKDIYSFNFGLDADLDGVVVKIVDDHLVRELGSNGRAPRWAVAMKKVSEPTATVIKAIEWSVTRTGNIAPVAVLEPVIIGGVQVSRANLHNVLHITERKAYPGAEVLVVRSAEVIPKIVAVTKHAPDTNELELPKACPGCGGPVTNDGLTLRCTAQWKCPEQRIQYLVHVMSKDCLSVDGFGEATIREISSLVTIENPVDLIETLDSDIYDTIRNGATLKRNLEAALYQPVWRVVTSLGLPGVGLVTAKRLPSSMDPYQLFNVHDALARKAPARAKYFDENRGWIMRYLPKFTYMAEVQGPLSGQVWCITGTLASPKHHYAKLLESKGARYSKTLSADVTHLLVGSDPGDKLKKAQKRGTQIVLPDEFDKYITF